MQRALGMLLACLVGLQPAVMRARQSGVSEDAARQAKPASPSSAPAPSAPQPDTFGLSFDRIKRGLRILPPSTAKTPLKLEYYVEVQGLMPPIPIFRPGELTTGPVPYGAPTHADMMEHVTPPEFKVSVIPVSSILMMGVQMLVQWEANRAREERLLEQRKRENEAERERQKRLKESIVVSPPK